MRFQGETEEDAKVREQKNYDELKSFEPQFQQIAKDQKFDGAFIEFLSWMIDVYAAEQCGRYKAPYPFLTRGGYERKTGGSSSGNTLP